MPFGEFLRVQSRGLARKRASPLPRIGIDEKSFKKDHSYITLIYDLDNSTVEAISKGKVEAAANACYSQFSKGQIKSIEAVAVDMSDALVKST